MNHKKKAGLSKARNHEVFTPRAPASLASVSTVRHASTSL